MKQSPFWTRRKTGIASAFAGLVVGAVAAGGGSGEDPQATAALLKPAEAKSQTDRAVSEATAALEQKVAEQQAELSRVQEEAATAQTAAVAAAVEAARKDEKAKAAAKVREAERRASVAEEEAEAEAVTAPQALAGGSGGGGTDPRFDTCGAANDAGYGPYRRGADPEYDWYDDRDGDGLVCES